jgi:tRNA-modifying protein YgfZ
MFLENQTVVSIENYLTDKFPSSLKGLDSFRYFTNSKEEYEALKSGVGLKIDFLSLIIRMTGKDVLDFVHRVSANAVSDLKPFEKRNTLFLNEKGRFIDRATLINLDNEIVLIGSPDKMKRLYSWINKYIIMEDIQTQDVSDRFVLLQMIGRQCESFLTMLSGKEVNLHEMNLVRRFDIDGFTFYFFISEEPNGVLVHKILLPKEKFADFIEYLLNIKSVFDFALVGQDAFDAFRIEKGIPNFPNEINYNTNPHEVNLLNELSFKKGCYIGQEVIARLDTYDKVQKKLVRVHSDESLKINSFPHAINDSDGNIVGEITSFIDSEILNENSGLALIRKKNIENCSTLFIQNNSHNSEIKISEI